MDALHGAIAALDAPLFWGLGAALLAATVWLLHRAARVLWVLRTLTDTPTARVRSAPQGYVELSGLARAHRGELRAPLSGDSCLWYRYRIEERASSGRGDAWTTRERGESDAPFLLVDGKARCVVEPKGADLRPRRVSRWHGSRRETRPTVGNRSPWGWLEVPMSSSRYRFTEERITDGEPLYVLGHLDTPRRGPEERERLRLALLKTWKRDPARMARFDTDGDGEVDAVEWERARIYADRVAERSEHRLSRESVLPRLGATGDTRRPFVVSAFAEDELGTTLGWQALGLALGFVLLASTLGYALVVRLGAEA